MNELTGRGDFKLTGRPLIDTDIRLERVTFKAPCEGTNIPGISADTKITCTFRGGQCSTCRHAASNHRINDQPRVFFIGDEHSPPLMGVDEDCCLVTRIDGGDFLQHRAFMEWQIGEGLRIKKGSVCVVSLVTHLIRSGQDKFWLELRDFAGWMAEKGCTVLPCLPPFPDTYGDEAVKSLHQFFVHLQAAHYGDTASGKNLRFSLWKPVCEVALEHKLTPIYPKSPPIGVPEISLAAAATCNSSFFNGFTYKDGQAWTHHIPDVVEHGFVNKLIQNIRTIAASMPDSRNLIIPSDDSLATGFTADYADGTKHEGKSIYLVGSSILDDCAEPLINCASMAGVEVINLSERGSYRKHFIAENVDLAAKILPLEGGGASDLAVLSIIGNEMVRKKTAFCNRDKWHVSLPELLTNDDIKQLVKDVEKMVETMRGVGFGGKILVLGPLPRHLEKCCKQTQHQLKDGEGKEVKWEIYTDVLTLQLEKAINLPKNVEFVPYREIFGGGFTNKSLKDGVHLDGEAEKVLANFIFRGLDRAETSERSAVANRLLFSSMLARVKIVPKEEVNEDDVML